MVRREVVRAALHRNNGVPAWLENGAIFGESGFSLELDMWTVNISRIQRETQRLLLASGSSFQNATCNMTAQLKDLLRRAINLDNEMFFWISHLAGEWRYQTYVTSSQSPRATSYSGMAHEYPSLGHAVIWNRYRTLRIILKVTVIKVLRLLENHHGRDVGLTVEAAINSISHLINDICASIPFIAGEAREHFHTHDGNGQNSLQDCKYVDNKGKASEMSYLSFPLCTIINNFALSGTSYLQQQWIRSRLLDVSHVTKCAILQELACS